MVRVRCSHCPQVYQVPKERLGTQATCKKCQHTFTLEMSADETTSPLSKTNTAYLQGKSTPLPKQFGQYHLQRKLGEGAMGEVWLAHDPALDRDSAIKLMSPGIVADPERRQRFEREAKAAARLVHTNTVAVYSFGIEGEHAYLAMELVAGTSLDKIVSSQGPLPWREATRIICDAARGLAAAHEIGLVHRDVKPANLMRTPKGVTKVVDFGLAREAATDVQLTQAGSLLGTPAFMPPEQWMAGEVDARSDLYSLICTYYYLLIGQLPFQAPSLPALGYQHRYEAFPDPRELVSDLPDGVARILARGAQKAPADRYQSGAEFIAELESLLASPDESLPSNATWESIVGNVPTLEKFPPLVASSRVPRKPWWQTPVAWMAGGAGGILLLAATMVFFLQTKEGILRVEINDPAIEVNIKEAGITLRQADQGKDVTLTPGEKSFVVQRGDFEFETDKLVLKRGETVTVRVEFLAGEIQVRQGDKLLGSRRPPASPAIASSTPAPPPPAPPSPTTPVPPVASPAAFTPKPHITADRRAAEWVLSLGGSIRVNGSLAPIREVDQLAKVETPLRLTGAFLPDNSQVTDAGLACFQGCEYLEYLLLDGTRISDAGLSNFKACKNLKDLSLGDTQISDAGLGHLPNLRKLKLLNLNATNISDAGLARFEDGKEISALTLAHTRVSDAGLAHFQNCKSLSYLNLAGANISDAGLAHFQNCKDLEFLGLAATKVSDAGLACFRDCKRLTSLGLTGLKISNEGLAHFQGCKDLRALQLSGTFVSDAGLAHFRGCSQLQHLELYGTSIGDTGLAHFQGCKKITYLDLGGTKATDVGLAYFQDCQQLTHLILYHTKVSREGLAKVLDSPDLTFLSVAGLRFSDADLNRLTGLEQLRDIHVHGTQVTAQGIDAWHKKVPLCKIQWKGGIIEPE